MAEIVLFHHVQGLTDGLLSLAERFREAGHTVHTPDFFDGARPATLDEGMALAQQVEESARARADGLVDGLPSGLVYAGFSWGEMFAQRFAQQRPGARGALLYDAFVSLTAPWSFGPWPEGVPAQVHGMDADPFFAGEGDLEAARSVPAVKLFTYPGDGHLFADSSLASYDEAAAELLTTRSLAFLDRLGE